MYKKKTTFKADNNVSTELFQPAVKVTETGMHIQTMRSMRPRSAGGYIKKLNADEYLYTRTGEVRNFNHSESREDDKNQVARSMQKLRNLINANVTSPECCRWVTLTYAENMQDLKRLYNDIKVFNRRMRKLFGKYEYIYAVEPQKRGAWHAHMIIIFDLPAPYMDNKTVRNAWKQGFVNVRAVSNVDDIGSYLSAYLTDLELDEAHEVQDSGISLGDELKVVEKVVPDDYGNKVTKRFVKGGRLYMYPTGMNIYRRSKGIKDPEVYYCTSEAIDKKLQDGYQCTHQSLIEIENGSYCNTLLYQAYKKKVGAT